MSLWKAAALVSAMLLVACEGALPCDGPEQCSGNACCYVRYTVRSGSDYVGCTAAPDACAEKDTVYENHRRLCQTDADCTAGNVSTVYTKCCRASVFSHAAMTCTSPGLCTD